MALFPLPAAAVIRAESDLRPGQASLYYATAADLDADIAERIAAAAVRVESQLLEAAGAVWPLVGTLTEESTRQKALATEETAKRALVSLFTSAGQLNAAYQEKAREYERQADQLRLLLASRIAGGQSSAVEPGSGSGSGTLSLTPYRVNALGVLVVNS